MPRLQEQIQLIPANHLGIWGVALDVGSCHRKHLRHSPSIQLMFWNTSEAIFIHHCLVTHHSSCREGLTWLARTRKHLILSGNFGIECCFRCGETISEESSLTQTCHIHTQTQKVLKHLTRRNYYPCLHWNTIPLDMPRGTHMAPSGWKTSQLIPTIWV